LPVRSKIGAVILLIEGAPVAWVKPGRGLVDEGVSTERRERAPG
jgi:hypothetical protein